MIAALLSRWTAVVLSAALLVGAGLVLSRAAEAAPPNDGAKGSEMTSQPDFEALKSIPFSEVVERASRPYTLFLPKPDESAPQIVKQEAERALAKINELDPELRRLIWLTWVLSCWGPDEDEGLHTFFYLWGGDYAEQTLDALVQAGLQRHAAIFREAMAAFGPVYPADRKVRTPFFAWSQPATRIDETTTIPQPLNAFDHKIMALGAAFGSRDDYRRAIEEVVRASPRLRGWADDARDKFSDEDRLRSLTRRLTWISSEKAAEQSATWPAPYRQLYVLAVFNDEMLNGGVEQFFFNSSGALAQDVAVALRQANLPKHADAIEKGVALFPAPYPVDTQIRRRYFSRHGEDDWDRALDALTADVDDGAVWTAMLAIAKRDGVLPR